MDFRKPKPKPYGFSGARKTTCFSLCLAFLLFFPSVKTQAMDISISAGAANTGYSQDGTLPADLSPVFSLGIDYGINEKLSAAVTVRQEAVFGRKIAAECSYDTGLMKFTAGPVFGLLNGLEDGEDSQLLQPGVKLGFSIFFLNIINLEASSEFCILAADDVSGQIYPSQANLNLGFVFPSVICTAGINQKSTFTSGDEGSKQTMTDYGFYTEIFGKNSPVRFNVDFIYRTLTFKANNQTVSNLADTSAASIVIGGGLEIQARNKAFFLDGEGSVYTFATEGDDPGNPFLYSFSAGMRFSL